MFFDFLYPYQFSSYDYQLLAPFTANKTAGDICGIDIIVLFPDTKAYFIKVGLFFWHNLQILNCCYYDPGEEKGLMMALVDVFGRDLWYTPIQGQELYFHDPYE